MTGFKISGVAELDRAFKNFEPRLQKKIARKALRPAAKPLEEEVKRRTPIDTRQYYRTIKTRAMKRSRRNKHRVGVQVMTDPKWLAKVHKEIGSTYNPHWIEYGTSDTAAQPHFRPAMQTSRYRVSSAFQSAIRPLIAETAREVA